MNDEMRRCLFVDDEPLVLSVIQRVLRAEPLELVFAGTPLHALDLSRERVFDVVVSDFMMPQMNGAELLRSVRDLTPSSRRVLLTGHSDARQTFEAVRDGTIHLVLAKPFERETLVSALREGVAATTRG